MSKNKLVNTVALIVLNIFVVSAQVDKCGTKIYIEYKKSQDPSYIKDLEAADKLIDSFIKSSQRASSNSGGQTVLRIPVVVHVLYKTSQQNISDAQIMSQLKVMNEDFRRMNPDTSNTPEIWRSIAADAHIEFCLATQDPNGNPTNGIVRRPTKVNSFTTDDKVKLTNQGGDDAWDTKKYLNIWVCNLTGGLLGYGEFPTNNYSSTFGLVVAYYAFGTEGNVNANTKRGRTTIHEISHCFNLRHIWADDGGGCIYDDGVDDTPKQSGPSNGCPAFPFKDACQPDTPGIMFMNYLDYSNDACMNMFTSGQITRMRAALQLFYPSLLNSALCDSLTLDNVDATIKSIIQPVGNICSDTIAPKIVISNTGKDTLEAITIRWRFDNDNWQEYEWSGSVLSLNEITIELPTQQNITNGNHILSAVATKLNDILQNPKGKDTASINFQTVLTTYDLPYYQSFELTPFPGISEIKISNPSGVTWEQTSKAFFSANKSIFIDNKQNDHEGDIDAFSLPNIDLTSFTGTPYLKFRWAYARLDNATSDVLQVLISTDCGYSYSSLFNRSGTGLTTAANQSVDYIPVKTEWREAIISLSSYKQNSNAIIAFQNIAGGNGNNLFIDDINIGDRFTGLQETSSINKQVILFPNPANSTLSIASEYTEETKYIISDVAGKPVSEGILNLQDNTEININSLSPGLYIISFVNSSQYHVKFIKQ